MIHRVHAIIEATTGCEAHREIARLSQHALHIWHLLGIEAGHVPLKVFERVGSIAVVVELIHILHILHVDVLYAWHLALHILHHLHVLELLKRHICHATHVLQTLHTLHLHILQILQILLHVEEVLHLTVVWLLHLLSEETLVAVLRILPGLDLLVIAGA
jgi:hypothetical protein